MKGLPEKFTKGGFDEVFVQREGDVAIYKQINQTTGNFLAYDVFIVKKVPEKMVMGVLTEEHEAMPSNTEYGNLAFSCRDWDKAVQVFEKLIERVKLRDEKRLLKESKKQTI